MFVTMSHTHILPRFAKILKILTGSSLSQHFPWFFTFSSAPLVLHFLNIFTGSSRSQHFNQFFSFSTATLLLQFLNIFTSSSVPQQLHWLVTLSTPSRSQYIQWFFTFFKIFAAPFGFSRSSLVLPILKFVSGTSLSQDNQWFFTFTFLTLFEKGYTKFFRWSYNL